MNFNLFLIIIIALIIILMILYNGIRLFLTVEKEKGIVKYEFKVTILKIAIFTRKGTEEIIDSIMPNQDEDSEEDEEKSIKTLGGNNMLNLFVNTWGNYNTNGADGGEWITLPMDADELEEKLEQIAENMGDHDPEWAIHDYEWTCEWEGFEISEYDSIIALNEFVQQLDDLNEWEQKTYCAAVEYFGRDYVDIEDLND
mgnify:CR=1 FL=1